MIVKDRGTGEIYEKLVSKELHHANGNRGIPGFDEPINLREVWPWDHEELLPPGRKINYDFIRFKPVWVQNPDWQFNNDRPMIFVGQLEKKYDQQNLQHAYIFYVFWDRESGLTKTTIQ